MTISDYLNNSPIFNTPENIIFRDYFIREYGTFDASYNDIATMDSLWIAFKMKRKYDFLKFDTFYQQNNIDIFNLDKLGFQSNSKVNANAINDNTGGYQGFNVSGAFTNDKASATSESTSTNQSINYYDELLKVFGGLFNSLFLFCEIYMNDIMVKFYAI